jgi:ankyrin repeat protein
MLRAGADITARDEQGLTPLHACAEFIDEQRQWTKNEEAINSDQEIRFDRYRPYILRSSPKQPKKFTPYLSLRFSRAANYVGAYLLENAELSILSVTECLLSARADPVAKGTLDMITPMERASKLGCKGMFIALQRHLDASTFGVNPDNSALATANELDKKKILSEPWDFVSTFSIDDIAWLKLHQANFFMTLHKAEHEDSSFKRPFHRRFSFIEGVALTGLTQIMIQLGALARRDEDPDAAPIDKWTLNMISDNVTTSIPFEESGSWGKETFWKPESIHTVGDYFRPTLWKVEPLLLTACRRECPNMEMLRVLIEICGVDVNCPSVIYDVGKEAQQSFFSHDLLPTLAFSQRFWHLDAIRYLVGKGANINQQDRKGMTALHHACASDKTFSVRFVELLLELEADFNIKDNKDRSSVDLAENPLVLQVLGRYGANISDNMTKFLWLGIGKLNIELVQMALDNGADVNRKESCPIYTHEQLDWSIHSTPIHAREPAVPLAGALLYHDYTQPHVEKTGKDLRADIIKLLLDRGADPFGPMVLLRFSEDDKGVEQTIEEEVPLLHHIFDNSLCERRYLDLLVDYGLDFNKTGLKGETVFLAACNSAIIWTESYYFLTDDDEKEDKDSLMWDPSGLFLNMLDHGADISAVNADGDNALVSSSKSRLPCKFNS